MTAPVSSADRTRAVTVTEPGQLQLVERNLGPLAAGEVRIRLRAGGICGSDMHYYRHARNGDFAIVEPLILGHEIAGEIAAVGASVSGLAAGDHVAVDPSRHCGSCAQCRSGAFNLCENGFFMGSASRLPHMQGSFASLFDVTPGQCIVVSKDVPLEAVAMAEPLAVCLHALTRASNLAGARVAVMGCGPIGLLTAMACRHKGAAEVHLLDVVQGPLARAEALGFHTLLLAPERASQPRPDHFDIVFEAAGASAALTTALTIVRRGGTIVQIGNISGGAVPIPINLVMSKEIDLHGSFRFGTTFGEAVDLIVSGALDVQPLISSRHRLEDAAAAFALALDRQASMKVMLINS